MPRTRARLLTAAIAASGTLALTATPSADAGTYRAVQCHDRLTAGHADVVYARNSDRYLDSADCDGAGLGIAHEAGRRATREGRYGAWTLRAPTGTEIVRASAVVSGKRHDGHAPDLAIILADGARSVIAGAAGARDTLSWTGSAGRSLVARLACARVGRCGRGEGAFLRIRRIAVQLRDTVAPRVTPAGSLLAPGSRRGTHALAVRAEDTGSGVRSSVIEVNGDPLASRSFACRVSQDVALRLRPCPADPTARFDVATTARPFRQGPNQVRVCAADFAPTTGANRACSIRTVRVDNLCPVSAIHGAELRARFAGGGTHRRARSDETVRIVGRLGDGEGGPVAGAEVCVASRTLGTGSAETITATPRTDSEGRFRARLPAGPSREIRVAHWPGPERALERYLRLTTRAVPRLRVRPQRTLENGERARFRVALPGPGPASRRVAVQARADGRWIRVAGGQTNARGTFRAAYRFRSTSGRRTYAFRAIVPRQAGYPYAGGASTTRRATVVGRTMPG